MAYDVPTSVRQATEDAVNAAEHLTKMDAGAVATLLKLADQIDYLTEHGGMSEDGKFDNVSIPTYLRYAESLGLTPGGRAKPGVGAKRASETGGQRGLTGLQGGAAGGRRG